MVKTAAKSPDDYVKSLPPDRRAAIETVRKVILDNLPQGYEEYFLAGMLMYSVPLKRLPDTYNGHPLAYAALASQKNYMSVYLMSAYGDKKTDQWLRAEFQRRGKRLDMGKSCIRFKSVDDLPLDVIGEAIAKTPVDAWIRVYRQSRAQLASARAASAGRGTRAGAGRARRSSEA
jgi:hypothetical protein